MLVKYWGSKVPPFYWLKILYRRTNQVSSHKVLRVTQIFDELSQLNLVLKPIGREGGRDFFYI